MIGLIEGPLSLKGQSFAHIAKSAFISAQPTLLIIFFREVNVPQIEVPFVLITFVADCITISAPYCKGLVNAGDAQVASTIIGIPNLCASFVTSSISKIATAGLEGNSPYTKRVPSSICDFHSLRS